MITVGGLLEGPTEPTPVLAETGLSQIDHTTGGLQRGAVWIVTGAPGDGTSLLLLQLALRVAMTGRRAALHAPRGDRHDLRQRILAHLTRTPIGSPIEAQHEVYELARTLPLWIGAGTRGHGPIDLVDREVSIIDDADLVTSANEVGDIARRGHAVVLGLPRDRVMTALGLEPSWSRVADVILQVETDCWAWTEQPGISTLRLLKHRWGPLCEQDVAFEPAYARFRDTTFELLRDSAQR